MRTSTALAILAALAPGVLAAPMPQLVDSTKSLNGTKFIDLAAKITHYFSAPTTTTTLSAQQDASSKVTLAADNNNNNSNNNNNEETQPAPPHHTPEQPNPTPTPIPSPSPSPSPTGKEATTNLLPKRRIPHLRIPHVPHETDNNDKSILPKRANPSSPTTTSTTSTRPPSRWTESNWQNPDADEEEETRVPAHVCDDLVNICPMPQDGDFPNLKGKEEEGNWDVEEEVET